MDAKAQEAIDYLHSLGTYRVLKHVPSRAEITAPANDTRLHQGMILDLETMGLEAQSDKIIELGLLSFSFDSGGNLYAVTDTYNALQDPGEPIPQEITDITSITNEAVKGQSIDWQQVLTLLEKTDLCIAHNSNFDRGFLEGPHVPDTIRDAIMQKPFACTQKDIDWRSHGFESTKLEYLNFKTGFFYGGHRALNDCEATLNILIENDGVFKELLENVRQPTYLIIASHAPFEKKDLLKKRSYRWSTGEEDLPKGWWTTLTQAQLDDEYQWLDEAIYGRAGRAESFPQKKITARTRYSPRALVMEPSDVSV